MSVYAGQVTTVALRALIYCRASSDPKMKLRSVGDQEQDCRALCDQQGWSIADVVVDSNRSATKWAKREREGWESVLDRLSTVDVLVMWEASRAARRMEGFVELRSALEATGTLLAYGGRIYDLSRGDDAFTAGLDALLAEREASSIRDRIVRTVRIRAEKGKPAGRVPFGYRRRYDPNSGDLLDQVVDEVTGPIVRDMATRVLAGQSCMSIAADMQRRDVPIPGGVWKSRTVKRILETPSIAGLRVHQGAVIGEATWPAIITPEVRNRVLAVLASKAARGPSGTGPRYLLGHIAKCGGCGRVMESRGRTDRKVYECTNSMCTSKSSILAGLADEWVDTVVSGVLRRSEFPVVDDDPLAVNQADTETLATLIRRVGEAGDAYADGTLSLTALQAVEKNLQPRIAELEAKLRPSSGRPDVQAILTDSDPEGAWKNAPLISQRGVIRALFDIRVYRAKRRGVFDPDRIRIELAGSSTGAARS